MVFYAYINAFIKFTFSIVKQICLSIKYMYMDAWFTALTFWFFTLCVGFFFSRFIVYCVTSVIFPLAWITNNTVSIFFLNPLAKFCPGFFCVSLFLFTILSVPTSHLLPTTQGSKWCLVLLVPRGEGWIRAFSIDAQQVGRTFITTYNIVIIIYK